MKQEILDYAKQVLTQDHMKAEDIPQLALYMDQIVNLMDAKLETNKKNPDDKVLTKTMIHNYSKAKIIKPIKGKTYPREQILQLLMVYVMKNVLSMEQLKQVMSRMYIDEDLGEEGFEECYDRFLKFEENKPKDILAIFDKLMPDDKGNDNYKDALVSLLCITSLSDQLSKVADKIVDAYFPLEKKNKHEKKEAE